MKFEIERTAPDCFYMRLPNGAAVWIERNPAPQEAAVIREGGEWLAWIGRLHVIVTPMGWKPHRN